MNAEIVLEDRSSRLLTPQMIFLWKPNRSLGLKSQSLRFFHVSLCLLRGLSFHLVFTLFAHCRIWQSCNHSAAIDTQWSGMTSHTFNGNFRYAAVKAIAGCFFDQDTVSLHLFRWISFFWKWLVGPADLDVTQTNWFVETGLHLASAFWSVGDGWIFGLRKTFYMVLQVAERHTLPHQVKL